MRVSLQIRGVRLDFVTRTGRLSGSRSRLISMLLRFEVRVWVDAPPGSGDVARFARHLRESADRFAELMGDRSTTSAVDLLEPRDLWVGHAKAELPYVFEDMTVRRLDCSAERPGE